MMRQSFTIPRWSKRFAAVAAALAVGGVLVWLIGFRDAGNLMVNLAAIPALLAFMIACMSVYHQNIRR